MPAPVSSARPAGVRFEPYPQNNKGTSRLKPDAATATPLLAEPPPSNTARHVAAPLVAGLSSPSAPPAHPDAIRRSQTAQAQLFFESAALPEKLKREVMLHIARIPPAQAMDYSRSLQRFTLKPNARAYPFLLHYELLQDIIDAKPADPVRILSLAVDLISDSETVRDKSNLYSALIKLGQETPDRDRQILWALKKLPSFALRLEAISHLPRWQRKLMSHLGTYLQCLEPVLPTLRSVDFRSLNSWPAAMKAMPAVQEELEDPPLEPMGLCALQDFDEDEVLERMEEQADRPQRGLWQDLRHDQDENIMLAKRHFAAHAAVGSLLAAYPIEPPTEALTPIIDLFLNRLADDASLRQQYGVTALDVSRAERSWSRTEQNPVSKPINGPSIMHYLGDYKMPSARFAALIWRCAQSFVDADKTWQTSAISRSTMTTAFIKSLARIQSPVRGVTYPDLPDNEDVETSRRCHVGVTQELLSGLAGFYPFSLDQVTPAELLSVLAQNAFGGDAADSPPDMYQVISFAEEARRRAKDIFKEPPAAKNAQTAADSPKVSQAVSAEDAEALKRRKTDVEVFDQLLEEYLAYDFEFHLPTMARTPSI